MTNKEKFKEVFGFEPDTETMIPVCPPRGVECPFMDDGIYSECHCELWWGREYKAPKMTLRTKGEQKAYLDGYEMCADCIEKYLTDEGKRKLEVFLVAVRNAVEIEDSEVDNGNDD